MTMLEVSDLAADFGPMPGFRGVSLSVEAGECLAVLGPSGVGKTTLLRAIAGFAPIRHGRVAIKGHDVTALPPERRDAVYLHQTPLLFPHLSVFENVAFPLRLRRVAEPAVRDRVRETMALLGVDELGQRNPVTLSGGQRHRVALARAMVARPAMLLLDEPLASLDPARKAEARTSIARVQAGSGAGLLLVTHDMEDAGALASRVAVMLGGSMAQVAPPGEVFRHPASAEVARFLGFPNELPGEVRSGCFQSPCGAFPTALPDGPAVALLPAEGLVADPDATVCGVVTGITWRPAGPLIHLRVPACDLVFAGSPAAVPPLGSEVRVRVDPARLNLYQAERR